MTVASSCLILLVLWVLLAYVAVPLPFQDPFFAWVRRQWLMEGIAVLVSVGVLGALLFFWRKRTWPKSLSWWMPWLLWLGWSSLSLWWSIDRGVSLRNLVAFSSYGLLALLASWLSAPFRNRKAWAQFLAWTAVIVSLEGLMQYGWTFRNTLPLMEQLESSGQLQLQGWGEGVLKDFLIRKRIFSVFGWPNLYAGFLLLAIPLCAGLARSARTHRGRIGWGVASAMLGLSFLLTLSMGGWFAAIITGCLVWWLSQRSRTVGRPRMARMIAMAAGLCVLVGITSFIVAQRAQHMITSSTSSRLVYLHTALSILQAFPLAGTGFGTFGLAYWALMPERYLGGAHSAIHAHNTLAQMGAELGLVGLTLFLWFLVRVWRLIVQAFDRRGGEDSGERVLSQALAIGVVGFFVHSVLEQTFYEAITAPFWWIVLGLLSGTAVVAAPNPQPPTPNRVGLVRSSAAVIASLVLLLTARFAMADAWAARAAWQELSSAPIQRTIALWQRAERSDPWNSRFPLEQGERCLRAAQVPQAAAAYQRVVARSPWLGFAWFRLGQTRSHLGDAAGADEAFRQAKRRDPNLAYALRAAKENP